MKVTYILVVILVIFLGSGIFAWSVVSSRRNKELQQALQRQTTPSPTPPATATLEIFSPPVRLVLPGATNDIEASKSQEIPVGTKIKTGDTGRAQLVYPNKSVTRLDFNTEIVLKQLNVNPQQVIVGLNKKRIWSRVAKLLGQEYYQSETSTTIATVRGTSYAHGILPDGRNRVISTKGAVESSCANKTQEATVTPNSKILFDCTSGGKLPLLALDAVVKDRDEWFTFNQEQDKALDERFGKDTYGD